MKHVEISPKTHLQETLHKLTRLGLLLVSAGTDGKPNAMTIGWGTIGVIWGKRIFTVLVRPSRYTYKLLGESDSFTVCVPSSTLQAAVSFCGTRSGRDYDKFKECDLTPLPSTQVSAPGIAECPIVYECQIERLPSGGRGISVKMTLTAPGCGMGPVLTEDVREKIEIIPTVEHVDVELVFDPPWNQTMMSEAARLEAGLF